MYVDDISFDRAASIFIESDTDNETVRNIIKKKSIKQILVKMKRQSWHIKHCITKLRIQKNIFF